MNKYIEKSSLYIICLSKSYLQSDMCKQGKHSKRKMFFPKKNILIFCLKTELKKIEKMKKNIIIIELEKNLLINENREFSVKNCRTFEFYRKNFYRDLKNHLTNFFQPEKKSSKFFNFNFLKCFR